MNDKELVEFTLEFRKGILGKRSSELMCFMVCAPLVTLLNMNGVECGLAESDVENYGNHIYIVLADGRVLDPTVDQFDSKLPPVYLGKPIAWHQSKRRRIV